MARSRLGFGFVALLSLLLLTPVGLPAKSFAELMEELGYQPVKLQVAGNHFFVDVKINGRTRRAGVDTGASLSAVDDDLARKLPRTGSIAIAGLKDAKRDVVRLEQVELGGSLFTNVPAAVTELRSPWEGKVLTGTHLPLRSSQQVILGKDFLERSHAVLHVAARTLYLRASAPAAAATNLLARTLAASGMTNSPLSNVDRNLWVVPARMNGHTLHLAIDTGAFATEVDVVPANAAGVTGQHTKFVGAGTENRRSTGMAAKVDLLEVCECRFVKYPVGVSDLQAWGLGKGAGDTNRVDGLLACDVLGRAKAILDCHAARLWVVPATIKE